MTLTPRAALPLAALIAMAPLAAGCSALSYYRDAAVGQWRFLAARRDVAEVMADPRTPPATAAQLKLVESHLEFAERHLALEAGHRYSTYVEVEGTAAVWIVFAAPEFSVRPHRWCYPVVGCLVYRGFFDQSKARAAAGELEARGFDAHVRGAAAYSTLGWFDDPLLSTFVSYPDAALAELLFHELAHGKLFLPGDSAFNEAFATFVGQQGVADWLRANGRPAAAWRERKRAEARFTAFMLAWRERLARLYAAPLADDQRRVLKAGLLREMRACHAQLAAAGIVAAALPPVLNNAHFVSVAAYGEWTGAFAALFDAAGGDWPAFYAKAWQLAKLEAPARKRRLAELARGRGGAAPGNLPCESGEARHPQPPLFG